MQSLWIRQTRSALLGACQGRLKALLACTAAALVLSACGGAGGSDVAGGGQVAPSNTSTPGGTAGTAQEFALTKVTTEAEHVALGWNALPGAARYQVYLEGNPEPLVETSATSFNDTSVTADTTYNYQVKALDHNGRTMASTHSMRVVFPHIKKNPPGPVINPSASLDANGHVKITWSAPTEGSRALLYIVERSDSKRPLKYTWRTHYEDARVQPGATYQYWITALDLFARKGERTRVPGDITIPGGSDTTAPSVPAGLQGKIGAAGEVLLSWSASTDDTAVVLYEIAREDQTGVLGESDKTSFADDDVQPGKSYTYKVRALDTAGNASAWSAPASVQVPQTGDSTAPSIPVSVAAKAVAHNQIDISWAPSNDNVRVVKYQIKRAGAASASFEATDTRYSDKSVVGATDYAYQVRALDAAGNASDWSAVTKATTPAAPDTTAPSVPAKLSATAPSATRVELTWEASSDNVKVVKYEIVREGTAGVLASTDKPSYSDTSAKGDTTYVYRVRALDAANNQSALSASATVKTPAQPDTELPSVPGSLKAKALGTSEIELTWTASTDNVGVAKYLVYRVGTNGVYKETKDPRLVDSGLKAGTSYSYQVRAVDAANNESALSASAQARTEDAKDTQAPTAPANLKASAVSATQVDLGWSASNDNVGVVKYQILRNGSVVAETGATTYSDTKASPKTTYTYTVKALDAAGNVSAESAGAKATTQDAKDTQPPSTPAGLKASAANATTVNLTWTASNDNVGVVKYQVLRDGKALAESTGPAYTDSKAAAGTTYTYAVKALDAAGNASGASADAKVTTPAATDTQAPAAPTNVKASAASATTVSLTWTASTDNVGVVKYQVLRDGKALAESTSPSYTDNTAAANTTYTYAVKALDAAGNASAASADAKVTTPGGATNNTGANALAIVSHPVSQAVEVGKTTGFGVRATGTGTIAFQWQTRANASGTWSNINGQTQSNLAVAAVTAASEGVQYRAIVTNGGETVTSKAATVRVLAAGKIYYVATNGSDSNPGTLEKPWRTMAYAVGSSPAQAGATIYVKAGNYGAEVLKFKKDGIALIGYQKTPGDQPPILAETHANNYYQKFDPSDMPLLDGGDRTGTPAMNMQGRKNITLRNISVTNHRRGLEAGASDSKFVENHMLFNVNTLTLGNPSGYDGQALMFGSMSTAFSNGNTVQSSLLVNATAEGLTFAGDNNMADSVKVVSEETGGAAQDYLFMLHGSYNVIQNSYTNRGLKVTGGTHGFTIKSNAEQIVDGNFDFDPINPTGNEILSNLAVNTNEAFTVRHRGVQKNVFRSNRAQGTFGYRDQCHGDGIVIRDGASNNQFFNTTVEGGCQAIVLQDTTEDGDHGSNPPGHPNNNNVIDGITANNVQYAVDFNDYAIQSDAGKNTIKNGSFTNVHYLFNVDRHAKDMKYINVKFTGRDGMAGNPPDWFLGGFTYGSYTSDIVPAQFENCTFDKVRGGVPKGF